MIMPQIENPPPYDPSLSNEENRKNRMEWFKKTYPNTPILKFEDLGVHPY